MMIIPKTPANFYFCALACAAIGAAYSAGAAEWSIEPSITASTNYSDNIRLLDQSRVAQPIKSNLEVSLSPAVVFGHETEVRSVKGRLRVAVNRFNNDKELDSNDAFVDINWREKGERSEFSFVSNNTFDSTLATALLDVGNPTTRKQRQKISVSPTYSYNFDDRLALALGYRFEDVGFRDTQDTTLVDYRSSELLPSLRYKLDEKNEVEVNTKLWQLITIPQSLAISRGTFKTGLLGVVYNKIVDERTGWSAGAGFYSIDENTSANNTLATERKKSFSGATALAKYQWRDEYSNASFILAREINPSGENTLLLTNRIGADYSQGLSPYLTAGVSAGYYKNDVIGGAIEKDSKYFRVSPNLVWKPAREWQIDLGASYQRSNSTINLANNETKAKAKSAYLNFIYYWDKAAISR
jgi:hypothetical protein